MSLTPGSFLGHYEIIALLGAGGMGEVWRARDTTLDRDVAIKVLPPAFTSDPERLARFEREAKVLASLNHPHVAAIHGLHEAGGQRFLSMELVPGEDVSQRLARGPLPVEEALAVARQVVEALEYAHDRGIVHRDLKPANIRITPDGDVKVLDYGLAKAMVGDPALSGPVSTPTMLPTVTSAGTAAGMILGTAAYMSPEQARGRPVDKRADIWAFGCVLWEMLTGRRPFDGETVTDVLAVVLTREPDLGLLPSATPQSVRRLLKRCLDKDARTRLRDIGEGRIALGSPGSEETAGAATAATGPMPSTRSRAAWVVGAILALAAGAAFGRLVLAPTPAPTRSFEFEVMAPDHRMEMGSVALSPDGSMLAFLARNEDGVRMLHVRNMDSIESRVLPGTVGALYPFWSRDGREIGYFAENQLLRIALDAAAPRPVGLVPDPIGGSWGVDDVILVGSASGPIRKLSASGGRPPVVVTEVDKEAEDNHAWPAFLPDGKRFVFLSDASSDEGHRIRLGDVAGGPTKILKKVVRSQPIIDPAGRLLLTEVSQLVAYPFNLESGVLGEQSVLIAGKVYPMAAHHHASFSAAAGTLAFQTGSADLEVVLLDFEGRVVRKLTEPDRIGNPAISPDGRRISFEIFNDGAERLVWVQDLERGVRTPVSTRTKAADSSAWSADGETVYFDSNAGESGKWDVYRKAVSGGAEPVALVSPTRSDITVLDTSADGHWLLTAINVGENRNDLYLHDLTKANGAWVEWCKESFEENFGSFSPDSRWIAYTTDASGRMEVYVAPVDGGPSVRRFQISSGGGLEPRFSPDGKKIFYRSAKDEWMSVDVEMSGDRIDAKIPKVLFPLPVVDLPWVRNVVDVMPDGSGFIVVRPVISRETTIRVRTGGR